MTASIGGGSGHVGPAFVRLPPPSDDEAASLLEKIKRRIEKRLAAADEAEPDADDALAQAQAESVQTRWAPPPETDEPPAEPRGRRCAFLRGYSLHAAVAVRRGHREGLEVLCRYGLRPPLALERMSEAARRRHRAAPQAPRPDGSTHLRIEPLELLKRLASIVPPPRSHPTRYHGVFSAHGLDGAAAWAIRERHAEAWPHTAVRSVGATLGKQPRGADFVWRMVAQHRADLHLLKVAYVVLTKPPTDERDAALEVDLPT